LHIFLYTDSRKSESVTRREVIQNQLMWMRKSNLSGDSTFRIFSYTQIHKIGVSDKEGSDGGSDLFFSRSVTDHEGHQASTCVLAQAWSNCELFQQLRTCCSRTCCSRCRFSAPAHLLLWMPIFSTCALAALDSNCALAALDDFQQRRTCCSGCRFSGTLDADFQHLAALRTCCSGYRFSAPAHLMLWMPIFSTCALAALDADFQHLRTCCSGCRFAALDADFEHLRTCCSGCRFSAQEASTHTRPAHLLLWMPIFSKCARAAAHLVLLPMHLSSCALAALDADFQHLRTCCSGCRF